MYPHGPIWRGIVAGIAMFRPEILVTSELPFGGLRHAQSLTVESRTLVD
jgi:hypothetical protein